MNPKPAISVVMPVLDPHPVFFPEAVKSVLSQSFADLELIIVEDPSASSAAALLEGIRDERVVHHRNHARTSLIAQRNHGLGLARGDWVALLDADDVSEPRRLQEQLAFLQRRPEIDVLGCQLSIIDQNGRVIGYRSYPREHDQIARAMKRLNPLAQSSLMFRRQLVLDAGGYRYERYPCGEDYDLWCRLMKGGARFANHPELLLRYRIQPGQLKLQRLREHLLCTIDIKRTYWEADFDLGDRLRFWAERGLLTLPPSLVLRLFQAVQYQKRPPA
jgi:glycosyltransferase involved in cell wall biosynthesis